MRRLTHYVRAGGMALVLAFLGSGAGFNICLASPATPPSPTTVGAQQEQIQVDNDDSIHLSPDALPAPASYGPFNRFGLLISSAQQFASPTRAIRLDYTATIPTGSAVLLDVRGSVDGVRWTSWEVDLSSGATIDFAAFVQYVQYRATLLSNGRDPIVRKVRITPLPSPALYQAMEAASSPVAPTFRVYATRMGMVGGRTANGYRIKPHDHFVSLPSRRSLCSYGGKEYMVRITYKGRSSVAPVYDVGPWNIHDDYWDVQRERFKDLRRGWPEDHAAYFDGYNHGRAEEGRVSIPTAVDVGDGVWWDDLGIVGGRAVIDVTFLWLGTDPLAVTTTTAQLATAPAVTQTMLMNTQSATLPILAANVSSAAPTGAVHSAPVAKQSTATSTAAMHTPKAPPTGAVQAPSTEQPASTTTVREPRISVTDSFHGTHDIATPRRALHAAAFTVFAALRE